MSDHLDTDTERAAAREAALRDVLEVISRSRDNEGPVFETILRHARRLCGAPAAALVLGRPGDAAARLAAHHGVAPEIVALYEAGQFSMDPEVSLTARAIAERRTIHVEDMATGAADPGNTATRAIIKTQGIRTNLFVPLLSGDEGIGCLILFRTERRPYTAAEIALVEAFAAQAVIAIENVRQFREVQARLEREQATRAILEVINSAAIDEQPVFYAILSNAARLCRASRARMQLVDDARENYMIVASWGGDLQSFALGERLPLASDLIVPTSINEARTVHVADLSQDPAYLRRDPVRVRLVEQEGLRAFLAVPLLKDGKALGSITLSRSEPTGFADSDIALVETFAAQAVIAIENVRQFRALQSRLAREQATGEILGVIARSRDDDAPVFQTIFENLMRLCDTPQAFLMLASDDGGRLEFAASRGKGRETLDRIRRENPIALSDDTNSFVRAFRTREPVMVEDTAADATWQPGEEDLRAAAEAANIRTTLIVPLPSGARSIGVLVAYRHEVRPYTADEIALHSAFAAQAAIAIENVRQFRALQTRLEREQATGEILGVISQSRDDEKPVFDAILANASRLCRAPLALLAMTNEARTHVTIPASLGARTAFGPMIEVFCEPIDATHLLLVRPVAEGKVIRVDDISDDDLYRQRNPYRVRLVETEGIRSLMAVPLISGGIGVGAIILYRREVAPFSDDDLALVEAFAAQAAIAIENVRQFRALEASNAEVRAQAGELQRLNEGLEGRVAQQVGEIERMGRLKRFLSPAVADAVISAGDDRLLGSHRALIATLFCDIRGFTAFCETAEPEETIEVLQTYHEEMGRLIAAHGAGVDHRMGDGIMVIFNDPLPCDDPAGDALRLALAMRARMVELCRGWKRLGHRLGFGVGISLGYATVGMVGSEGRFDYTASGTAVNLAARLCDEAADGEILLSPRAQAAVEDMVGTEPRGELSLKGIQAPVAVWRVIGLEAEA